MADERTLASLDDLGAWAQDDGLLDDSIVVRVDPSTQTLTLALALLEERPVDPRDAFRRQTARYQSFTMRALAGGELTVDGELADNAPFEYGVAEDGEAFGVELDTGDARVRAVARTWSVAYGPELVLPVERSFDATKLTFHGPGPLIAADLREAMLARVWEVALFGNWNGSGQSFGAAFVRKVMAPAPVPDAEALDGAWRIVPTGVPATDGRGVWLSGASSQTSVHASLERTAESDPQLVRALVEGLASLPGLAWAASGNTIVEDAAMRTAWCALDEA